ncbi:MAG: inverse autotransporter beta domain-containing protein [Pseudomonadota bacterium]
MTFQPGHFRGAWRTGLTALAAILASAGSTWSDDQWQRVADDAADGGASKRSNAGGILGGTLRQDTRPALKVQIAPEAAKADRTNSFIPAPTRAQAATPETSVTGAGQVQPRISFQAQAGTEDESGTVDMFVPIAQTPDSVAYFDVRGVATGDEAYEGNIGLGYRQTVGEVFGEEAVVGGFVFFDVRKSVNQNTYYQGTVGLEFLTDTFEARAMGYLPNADRNVIAPGTTRTVVNGTAVQRVTSGALIEQALPGAEVELGLNFDLTDAITIRGTGGYYHFERDLITVAGPKARAAVQFADPFGLDGATLSLGGEIRDDDFRDTDASGFVRLSIPIGVDPKPFRSLSARTKKLSRYVYRDRDIVVPTVVDTRTESVEDVIGAAPPPNSAPGTPNAQGQSLDVYHVADTPQGAADCTSYADACTVDVAQADPNYGPGDALIVVDSGGSTINSDIFLNGDLQSVLGANAAGQVTLTLDDAAGSILTLGGLGGRVTVAGTVQPAPGSRLSQFNIDGGHGTALSVAGNLGPTRLVTDDIDITGGSTGLGIGTSAFGAMTVDADSSIIGTTTGILIESSAFELTVDGTIDHTGSGRAIDIRNHTNGSVVFNGAITASNGMGLGFDNADSIYQFNAPVVLNDTGTASGVGIDITNGSDGTFTFAEVDITNTAPATARPGPLPIGSAATGIDISDSPNGTFTFSDLDITSAADFGIIGRNGGTVHIGDAADPSEIAGGTALMLFDTSATVTNARITGGTDTTDFDIAAPTGSVEGDFPAISEGGVLIVTELQDTRVSIQDSTISGAAGLVDISTGDSNHELALDRTSISSTDLEAVYVENLLLDPAGTGETFITSLDSNTVTASDGGGMYFVDTVFDSDPTTVATETVTGGATTIGTTSNRVRDEGLVLEAVLGDLNFTDLDIGNRGGRGLLLDNNFADLDPFKLTIQDGTIDTLNSGALLMASENRGDVTLDVTLSSITSTGGGNAVRLRRTSGTFDVTGTTDLSGYRNEGIDLRGNDAVITFGTTSVTGTGSSGDAISLLSNRGAVTFGTTTVDGAGDDGIDLENNRETVTFGATTIKGAIDEDGIDIDDNPGAVIFGDTSILAAGDDGFENKDSSGDVTFGALTISDVSDDGIQIEDSSGDVTFNGAVKIDNLDNTAIEITGSTGQTIAFNSTTDIGGTSRLLGDGLHITGTDSLTAITFADLDITVGGTIGAPGDQTGIDIDDAEGMLTITTGTVDSSDGPALDIDGLGIGQTIDLNVTLTNLISEGSDSGGIILDDISGNLTIQAGRITGAQGTAFDVGGTSGNSGGDATVVYNGIIDNTSGRAVLIQELAGGSITLGGDITDTGDGIRFRRIDNGTAASVTISGNTSLDGGAIEFDELDDATITISGNVTIAAADNSYGIEFDDNVGTVEFTGDTSITAGNGASGILFDTNAASQGTITFDDLDIALTGDITTPGDGANGIAFNAAGAEINGTVKALDFDVTGNVSGEGTTGIDLSGTTGTGSIKLGDDDTSTGESASIDGQVAIGVQFSGTTSVTFTYGDGEDADDQNSIIDSTIQINAPTPPTAGDYNFDDVDFTMDIAGATRAINNIFPSGSASDLIFVSAGGTNTDALNTTVNDPTSITLADAVTASSAVFVLINDGNFIIDPNGFTLDPGQMIDGFGNNNSFQTGLSIPMSFSGVPGASITVTDPFANTMGAGGAATLSSSDGPTVTTLGNNTIANVILTHSRPNTPASNGGNILIDASGIGSGETLDLGEHMAPLVLNASGGGPVNTGIFITGSAATGTTNFTDVEIAGAGTGLRVDSADPVLNVDRLVIQGSNTGTGIVLRDYGLPSASLATDPDDILQVSGFADGIVVQWTDLASTLTIGNVNPSPGAGTSITNSRDVGLKIEDLGTGTQLLPPTITFNGSITQPSGDSAVEVVDVNDLNIAINGPIVATTARETILATFGPNSTLSFTGGLDLTTTSTAEAIDISGVQTRLSITGAGNTLTTDIGAAMFLSNVIVEEIDLASITRTGSQSAGDIPVIDLDRVFKGFAGGQIRIGSADIKDTALRVRGALSADVHFDDLDIDLTRAGSATGIDLAGAFLSDSTISATDFDLVASTAGSKTGVNIAGTTGTGALILGDTGNTDFANGASASIGLANGTMGPDIGIALDANTAIDFTFGDGEDSADTGSFITATTVFTGALPTMGSYNFQDVGTFTGDTSLIPAGPDIFWVDQDGLGDGSAPNMAGDIAGAAASSAQVIALIDTNVGDGAGVLIGAGTGLVLDPGQVLLSLRAGDADIDLTQFGIPAGGLPPGFSFAPGIFSGSSTLSAPTGIDSGFGPALDSAGTGTGVTISGSGAIVNTRIRGGLTGVTVGTGVSGDFILQNVIVDDANVGFDLVGNGALTLTGSGNRALANSDEVALRLSSTGPGTTGIAIGTAGLGFADIDFTSTSTNAVQINGLNGPGVLTIDDFTGQVTGTAQGLKIDNSTADITVTGGLLRHASASTAFDIGGGGNGGSNTIQFGAFVRSDLATGRALAVRNRTGGTVTFSSNFLDNNADGGGILIQDNTNSTVTFSSNSVRVNTGANTGVSLSGNNGSTINFTGNLDIDTTNGVGLNASNGGAITIDGALTIDSTTGTTMSVINGGGGTFTASNAANTLASTTGEILNISNASVNATFASASATALNGSKGLDINNHSGTLTINGGTIRNTGSAESIEISGGASTIAIGTNVNSSGATGLAADIRTRTGGTVTLSGSFTDNGAAGGGILVQDNTSGIVTFSGQTMDISTGVNTAVNLVNNGMLAVNFNAGELDIDTSTGTGFRAVNGGVITLTDPVSPNNTIMVSGNGQAVLLQGITMGADGINFTRIDQTMGGGTAIRLHDIGATGAFRVSGIGTSAGSGGSLVNQTGNPIHITGTGTSSFNLLSVQGSQAPILVVTEGTEVANVTISRSDIAAQAGQRMVDLSASDASQLSFTMTGSFLRPFTPNTLINGLRAVASGSGRIKLDLSGGNTIQARTGIAIDLEARGNGAIQSKIDGNTVIEALEQPFPGVNAFATPIRIRTIDASDVVAEITNNAINTGSGTDKAIQVENSLTNGNTATTDLTVAGNTITLNPLSSATGLQFSNSIGGEFCANITGNSVTANLVIGGTGLNFTNTGGAIPVRLQGLPAPVNTGFPTVGALDQMWTGNGNTMTNGNQTVAIGSFVAGTCRTLP